METRANTTFTERFAHRAKLAAYRGEALLGDDAAGKHKASVAGVVAGIASSFVVIPGSIIAAGVDTIAAAKTPEGKYHLTAGTKATICFGVLGAVAFLHYPVVGLIAFATGALIATAGPLRRHLPDALVNLYSGVANSAYAGVALRIAAKTQQSAAREAARAEHAARDAEPDADEGPRVIRVARRSGRPAEVRERREPYLGLEPHDPLAGHDPDRDARLARLAEVLEAQDREVGHPLGTPIDRATAADDGRPPPTYRVIRQR